MCFFCARYEGALDPWLSSLWNMIKQIPIFSINLQVLDPDLKTVDSPKYQIIYHRIDMMQPLFSTSSGTVFCECFFFEWQLNFIKEH